MKISTANPTASICLISYLCNGGGYQDSVIHAICLEEEFSRVKQSIEGSDGEFVYSDVQILNVKNSLEVSALFDRAVEVQKTYYASDNDYKLSEARKPMFEELATALGGVKGEGWNVGYVYKFE